MSLWGDAIFSFSLKERPMKLLLTSLVLLLSVKSFASCHQLIGTWACEDQRGLSWEDTYIPIEDGMAYTTSNEALGAKFTFILDKARHTISLPTDQIPYAGQVTCASDDSGTIKLFVSSGTGRTIVGHYKIKNGNDMSLSSTSLTRDETTVLQITCMKEE
jgi:hypothetical protein